MAELVGWLVELIAASLFDFDAMRTGTPVLSVRRCV